MLFATSLYLLTLLLVCVQSDLTFTKSNSNGEGVIGGNINFSHLTMLANSIGSKLSIHHTVGSGHAKVHHEGKFLQCTLCAMGYFVELFFC